LINDDVRLARLADGVHLGQEDAAELDLVQLRRALRGGIIGLSCGTPQEARAADPALIDYVAAGPVFATPSKHEPGHRSGSAERTRSPRRPRCPARRSAGSARQRSRACARPAQRWRR